MGAICTAVPRRYLRVLKGTMPVLEPLPERLLSLLATADFPRWKRLWWRILGRPVMREIRYKWPKRFKWTEDNKMTWN